MWIITVYTNEGSIKMFEFKDEKEARESTQKIKDNKILSNVIYFNDDLVEAVI
ncbi:hypothetical protein [Psychrobacillus soli]|uniref:hypothetical protein n=1 Tax=Psychrobacillus soli TaxID=1543965 RepID=UPI00163CD2D2|nr:hypothetical protein [Psychrobacillus soli]